MKTNLTRLASLPLRTGAGQSWPAEVLVSGGFLLSWSLSSLCSGLITPGGFSSVPAGMETPELIELRKKKIEEAMDG